MANRTLTPPDHLDSADRRESLLTVNEVAAWIRCSPQAIYSWAECGQIPHLKIGRLLRFARADVQRFLEDARQPDR